MLRPIFRDRQVTVQIKPEHLALATRRPVEDARAFMASLPATGPIRPYGQGFERLTLGSLSDAERFVALFRAFVESAPVVEPVRTRMPMVETS